MCRMIAAVLAFHGVFLYKAEPGGSFARASHDALPSSRLGNVY